MNKLYLIITYIPFLCSLLAQQYNLKETFPLAVNYRWVYNFSIGSYSGIPHSYSIDSGIVDLEITKMIDSQDSTRWQYFQRREYYRDVYGYGYPISGWKKDSSVFEIIELKTGMHELYVNPFDKNVVFPYYKTFSDTEKIFRYSDVSLQNTIEQVRGINNGFENDYYVFTFTVDTGMVKSNRKYNNASSMRNWSRYYLTRYDSMEVSSQDSLEQDSLEIILNYFISNNYPNPFNPATVINYSLPRQSNVIIKIFDVLGREISTLVNEEKPEGNYKINFNAVGLTNGIYFYQMKAKDFIQTKKMILLR